MISVGLIAQKGAIMTKLPNAKEVVINGLIITMLIVASFFGLVEVWLMILNAV
jgi:hypothetical protein